MPNSQLRKSEIKNIVKIGRQMCINDENIHITNFSHV